MATKEQLKPFFEEIYAKSDRVVEALLIGYFVFGIGLSFVYDTYLVGIGVGSLSMILYFGSKAFFKGSKLNQYIASLVAGIFMAQFIYQMHGLFEMHFTAFIAIIALITYQNKWAFIPQLLFVVIHHSSFAYIQYLGHVNDNESMQQIYFTQMEYMDFTTFLFHAGLYALGVTLAAIYAHNLENNTINNAENILKLQEKEATMETNIEFANDIARGDLNTEYDFSETDKLTSALLEMRESLKKSNEREKQDRFKNVGVAEVGEIIRNNAESLEDLAYNAISYLVKYLNVNQGGMFILMEDDDEQKYLELKGCYAYDRKKYLEKRVEIGEGLVGQCYLEKDIIYLKEIPQDYVAITSGLGQATPNTLIIVPIKNDQVIEGVMEIAAFREFEQYEIDFLNKVAENIAATITSAKMNSRTKLLYEQSQQQTEEMRAQEEEMRQNMEELSATQEEMERKTAEFESRFEAIEDSGIGSIEFDLKGNIVNANAAFCETMKYAKDELIGKHHKLFVDDAFAQSDEYRQFWNDLAGGKSIRGEFKRYDKHGNSVPLYGAYSILKDNNGTPYGVMKFATDLRKTSIQQYAEV